MAQDSTVAIQIMERAAQMFPQLTPAQIERISSIGHRRDVRAGEVLFDVGDQNTRFFVVISGAIDIVRLLGEDKIGSATPLSVITDGELKTIIVVPAERSAQKATP